jgi:glycosyltransferase involved in cell wall biosynthesis
LEIIVVVDGNKELYNELVKGGIEVDKLKLILNEENLGLSQSRNRGTIEARGDIIAFFDDDAVADKNWVEELVRMYEEHDAIAAGGKILPKWVTITDEGDGVFDNRGRMVYYSRYPKM